MRVKTIYKNAYKKYGKSKKSLLWFYSSQYERFEIITKYFNNGYSILDFGCGFGDLEKFLRLKYKKFDYLGVDIVEEFVKDNNSLRLIDSVDDIKGEFDYTLVAGTFNIKEDDDYEEYVFSTIDSLISKTNRYLAVNFLKDAKNRFYFSIDKNRFLNYFRYKTEIIETQNEINFLLTL